MSDYPEHDKLSAVKDQSQAIGEFLDFGGYTLCRSRSRGDNGEPEYRWTKWYRENYPDRTSRQPDFAAYLKGNAEENPDYEGWGAGYIPVGEPIEKILAHYFKIDLDKIEQEKRQMLETIRAKQ